MFSSVFLFIMLLAFKHTHLISDLDVFPCISLLLLSSCTFRAFFDKPPCPTSLNIVLYPSHWQPPLRVPRQEFVHFIQYSTILFYSIQLRRPPCLNVHLPTKATVRRSNHPKLETFEWQPTLEIASMQSSYVTQNSGVRISISSRVRHLFIGFNTASACKRLGSGLPSACDRLGSIVNNPPHPLIPKRKTTTHRASPTQEPGPSVVVTIYVFNNLMDRPPMQTKTSLF